ncbi:ABC transporter ATP-binding protein [Psychromarinibacter sp. C21-152]|uniref:ABC transporter ATP-binding protein n=1 Tax=Psychromarinibacter sediminicola TaxID=3033385 RepID=A0AAE3NQQ6_9RHOB|nr:ABC transporter ATP-binding protein [Psychromarinibacter sediminicola]MDF0600724.1 ABC transporter ATP-binding protein [Psychromarinibacter sediminicola]
MSTMLSIRDVRKVYDGGGEALKGVSLEIEEGEILALLGPNGAGKTTLISIICGIATLTSGKITVGGHDVIEDFRAARRMIGLVPQEMNLEPFEKVINTVALSRGLHGLPRNDSYLDEVLKKLSLWDKRDTPIRELSGGMKRRVLIAKALSHAPRVLFLDEPTAGVDVELRKDMWQIVRELKAQGVTIILTTHYIEEAEAIADRIGVISRGDILLVEETGSLMRRMGRKDLLIELHEPVATIPESLSKYDLRHGERDDVLIYSYDTQAARTGITQLLTDLSEAGLVLRDVQTRQSSLEEIFVGLVRDNNAEDAA